MITKLIILALAVVIIALVINTAFAFKERNKRSYISLKESLDLVGLPVVTFMQNDLKLNFLIDSGSQSNFITVNTMNNIQFSLTEEVRSVINNGGKIDSLESCIVDITYKDIVFTDLFFIGMYDEQFEELKANTGVQIHGILGVPFFTKYGYVLDFKELTFYEG